MQKMTINQAREFLFEASRVLNERYPVPQGMDRPPYLSVADAMTVVHSALTKGMIDDTYANIAEFYKHLTGLHQAKPEAESQ